MATQRGLGDFSVGGAGAHLWSEIRLLSACGLIYAVGLGYCGGKDRGKPGNGEVVLRRDSSGYFASMRYFVLVIRVTNVGRESGFVIIKKGGVGMGFDMLSNLDGDGASLVVLARNYQGIQLNGVVAEFEAVHWALL